MSASEGDYGPRRPSIHAFIEAMLAEAEVDRDYKRPRGDATMLDALLLDVLDGK